MRRRARKVFKFNAAPKVVLPTGHDILGNGGIMKRVLDCGGMTKPAWKRLSRRHGGLPGPCVYVALRATVKWKV